MEKQTTKAIAMLSGGLDSTLACKIMKEQGIDLLALHFTSPFCTCTKRDAGCQIEAIKVANNLGIKVKVIHKGLDYLKIVEKPKFGYGRALNPCLDCRIYAFKKAKEIMEAEGAKFLITGEVLGQRPMSQRKDAIPLIEKESGLNGLIVRPLSAKLFPETIPETEGLIDRKKLLGITGRSRKEQIALASELGVTDYPCPAGGCRLTEPLYANKLRDLFEFEKDYTLKDINLLIVGRHFRLTPSTKIIVGKNEAENNSLESLSDNKKYHSFIPQNFKGPSILAIGKIDKEIIKTIGTFAIYYAKKEKKHEYLIKYKEEIHKTTNFLNIFNPDKLRI